MCGFGDCMHVLETQAALWRQGPDPSAQNTHFSESVASWEC